MVQKNNRRSCSFPTEKLEDAAHATISEEYQMFSFSLAGKLSDIKSTWSSGPISHTQASLSHELWKVPRNTTAPTRPPPGLTNTKPSSTWGASPLGWTSSYSSGTHSSLLSSQPCLLLLCVWGFRNQSFNTAGLVLFWGCISCLFISLGISSKCSIFQLVMLMILLPTRIFFPPVP